MSVPATSGNDKNPLGTTPAQQDIAKGTAAPVADSAVPAAGPAAAKPTSPDSGTPVSTGPATPLPGTSSTQTIAGATGAIGTTGAGTEDAAQQPAGLGSLPPLSATAPTSSQSPSPGEDKKEDMTKPENKDEKNEEEEEEEDEPQVVERVIIKEKGGGLGCFGLVKRLTCFIILIFLLLVAGVIALVIFRPPFLTEPLKVFLNGDYKPADVSEGITTETVESYIDEVTSPDEGEVTFQLTEDQLTTLVRARLADGADVRMGLEENKVQIFTDVAQNGEPLWVIVELTDSGDSLTFSRIGFGRINTPAGLREFVKERAFGFLGSVIKDLKLENSEQLVGGLVGGEIESGVTIKDVKFAQDLVLVTVEL